MKRENKESRLDAYIRKLTRASLLKKYNVPPDVKEWKSFIKDLPQSEDPIIQSRNKYKCRMNYFSLSYIFLVNIVAFFRLIKISISNVFLKLSKKKIEEIYIAKDAKKYDMVIQRRKDLDINDVFPMDLYDEFPNYIIIPANHDRTLIFNKDLKKAYKELARRNPFRFNYRILALKELALHSYLLENYNPKAIVVYINERNTLGPILKYVYEKQGREFIGFMHGTDLFHLIKSYMAFSRYYIWDKNYISMYKNDMNCIIDKYIVYTPGKNSYIFKEKDSYKKNLTYYVSTQGDKEQRVLSKFVKELEKKNINMIVRPHPRLDFNENLFDRKNIESPEVDIESSINNSEYVVGVSTTVIEQAYYGGKKILIDDISNKDTYKSLFDRKYLMISKIGEEKVQLFSKYLKNVGINLEDLYN